MARVKFWRIEESARLRGNFALHRDLDGVSPVDHERRDFLNLVPSNPQAYFFLFERGNGDNPIKDKFGLFNIRDQSHMNMRQWLVL